MLYANVLTESYTTGEYTAVLTDLGAIVRPTPNDVARTTSVAPLPKGRRHHPQREGGGQSKLQKPKAATS